MNRKLILEGFLVVITNIIAFFASFFIISITASKLSIVEYGSLALIFTLQAFFNIILFGAFNNGVQRFSPISIKLLKFKNFFSSTLKLGFAISAVVLSFFAILSVLFILFDKPNWIYPMGLTVLISIFIGLSEFIISFIISVRNRKLVLIIKIIDSITKILLLITYNINGYQDILIVYLISSVFYFTVLLIIYRKHITLNNFFSLSFYETYWIKKIIKYSIPFIIWGIFGWFQQSSIKWSLDFFLERDTVGKFNALVQISYTPVLLIFGTISAFLTPIYFQKIDPQKTDNYSKFLFQKIISFSLLSIIIIFLGSIMLSYIGEDIISLVFPKEYLDIKKYLPLTFISAGLFSIGSFITTIPFSLDKSEAVLSSSIIGSIIGIISAIIMVYYFEFMGGVIALFIHGFFHLVLTFNKIKKFI